MLNYKKLSAVADCCGNFNKKGHLPTIMLFICTLILVLTAWFTFLAFSKENNLRQDGLKVLLAEYQRDSLYVPAVFERIVERAILKADKNIFKSSFEKEFIEMAGRVEKVSGVSGNFFGKIRNKKYELKEENGIYTLTIKEVFIKVDSKTDKSELRREFELSVKFNKDGIIRS